MADPTLSGARGGLLPRAPNLTGWIAPHRFKAHEQFKSVMLESLAHDASDVYVQPGLPICARIDGDLMALTDATLDEVEVGNIIKWTANRDTATTDILAKKAINGRYEVNSPTEQDKRGAKVRYGYRANISPMLYMGGVSAQVVLRSIPLEPPHYTKIGLPESVVRACIPRDGIVYVAGATGSGKTTTFASIIRYILENETPIRGNLLTHEEPIEFTYDSIDSKHSILIQSEIPNHFESFYAANREAMRRKPGLIMIGEMRDEQTIRAGVEASLTGHPVFATVHATDVASVMRRLISRFPANDRATAIYDIVDTARMILDQRLVKDVNGKMMAVREYLEFTRDVRERLASLDQMGRVTQATAMILEEQGHSFRKEAATLLAEGRITQQVANSIWSPQQESEFQSVLEGA